MKRSPESREIVSIASEYGLFVIGEFEAAMKISPHEPNVHFGLGYLHWKSQQYDEAKKEFSACT